MKKILLSLLGLTLLASASFAQNVTVAGSTGADGSYATLGAAFAAINANTTQTGNAITVSIVGDTSEGAATAALNQPSGGSWTSLTISPSGGATRTISGATTAGSPMIDFNGADNVTVDGLNTGGNSLTISNTTVSATSGTSTIRFQTDATNNTITNCSVLGSATMAVGTNGGNIWFGAAAVTTGNDNNTISNCNLGPAGANLPSKCIYFSGTTTTPALNNSGINITNNNIFDYFSPTVSNAGIDLNTGSTDVNITNNRFYQTTARTQTTTGTQHSGIRISNTSGNNYQITGNTIGFASNTGTGTYTLVFAASTSGGFVPINLSVGTTTATSVQGNTIAGIAMSGAASGTSTSSQFRGIYVGSGLTTVGNITGNTIGSQSATGSITYTSSSTSASDVMAIFNFGTSNWTVQNNLIGGITASNSSTGAANVYGIRLNTSSTVTTTLSSNTIGGAVADSLQSTSTAAGTQVAGIFVSTSIATLSNNTIRNLTAAGGTGTTTAASVVGIDFISATPVNTASQNTIFNLSNTNATAATIVSGIQFTGAAGNVVARNLIYGLTSATNSATAEVNGIRVAGGTTTYRNNMIAIGAGIANALGSAAANSGASGINGFNGFLGTDSFFNNSIYIGGSPTAGSGASYAFNGTQTTNTRSFRDNIFFNARSNSGATGKNYAVKINGTAPNPTGLTINNNVYFANGAGAVFGFFNSLDVANLAAWKTAVGQDAGSFEGNPQYLDPTNATPDLHINPSVTTVIEGNGADVGVLDDFDGQTRASLTPVDIGADAGNFMGVDLSAPGISYTPLPNTNLLTNPVLSVTMTDATGVATGMLAPRIYFNKNGGAYSSTAASLSSGTVQNGVWDCTIDYSLLGGVVVTDVIRYFVVAQDTLGNLAANPSAGFVGTDVNNITTPPTTPNPYTILGSISGTFTVGAGGGYPSLTGPAGAITALNNSVITGPVVFNLIENATAPQAVETYPITINANPGSSATNTVTIKPNAPGTTITGSSAGALIVLNGADYVTIDGSSNGTSSRDLTITNTNTGTSAVVISVASGTDGAQNNTIKNVNVVGQDPTTTLIGISLGANAPGNPGTDNDNNRVENCSVKRTIFGIYSAGASLANQNTGTVITKNDLSATGTDRVSRVGILVFNENGVQITENSVGGLSITTGNDAIGIGVGTQSVDTTNTTSGGVTNALVSRNKIDGVNSASTVGFSAVGITVAGATGGANTIQNNMITGVTAPATSPDIVAGVYVVGATGSSTRLYYNSISMTGNRDPLVATQMPSYGIAVTGTDPTVELKNNIFYTTQTASGGGANAKSYTIGMVTTTFANLDSNYNDFYAAGANAGFFRSGSLGAAAGTDYATLGLWQVAISDDANSLAVDPGFVSAANDLHITGVSPVGNIGVPIMGVTNDFDGQTRSATTPDIGADEIPVLATSSAVSRKTHGAAGDFDINLPLTGNPGIECRGGGSYTVILTFSNNVVSGSASVTGTGSVSGSPTFSANTMTINLTGVTDIQQITVTASSVTDEFGQMLASVDVPMKVLIGDVSGTGNSTVNSTDVAATKAAVSAGTLSGANFRADVNASGTLTATDVSIVKSDVGHALP